MSTTAACLNRETHKGGLSFGSNYQIPLLGTFYYYEVTISYLYFARLLTFLFSSGVRFLDNWTKGGINEKGNIIEISDTRRYKMIGNAVSVPVVEALGRKMEKWFLKKQSGG